MKSARRKENVPNNTKPEFVESEGGSPPLRFTVRLPCTESERADHRGVCRLSLPLSICELELRVKYQVLDERTSCIERAKCMFHERQLAESTR